MRKAEIVCGKETYDISFLTAYISIFHSARAILFKKGYKERSHFCLFEFIRQEFRNDPDLVRFAEIGHNYREMRRVIQYEGSFCSEDSAKEAIDDAKKFLRTVKKLI
ncbi:HEPN domain-containing protein [Candidatus Micrarchaeota archaeon]|nr:HEPN domain-containing protein [Candidatus Micrarchaeota archaeon]